MRISLQVFLVLMASPFVSAFVPPTVATGIWGSAGWPASLLALSKILPVQPIRRTCIELRSAASETDGVESSPKEIVFSDSEMQEVTDLWNRHKDTNDALEEIVAKVLNTMHPRLIMKLRQVEAAVKSSSSEQVNAVAQAMATVLNSRLDGARQVLSELLDCGEIRKLDAAIGKAVSQGQLDMAFFTVLDLNLQDAQQKETSTNNEEGKEGAASRVQVLQHIYTRCQEEVEKNVPPGVALLNKLMRTDVESIRANQLEHYLCPQKNVITSPDGKEIQLEGTRPILVPPSELVSAMAGAVKQIRTVEKAGGSEPETAARMVELCRNIAKEARIVIGNNYGVDSDELKEFESGLQPVFRPSTPDSVYIKGE